tara:strand:+ start:362 stop:1126 length:765 start_codon:yes stop_codon:yes gene_type:complete
MIKFFRKIRKNLLMENKTGKYFTYAIGEIVLVVIGILIALQVNNRNEYQKERKSEIRYLERIKSDLMQDSISISGAIRTNLKRKKRAEYLLQLSKNKVRGIDRPTYFVQSIEFAGYTHSPRQTDHTYEEIKSAGNMSLILNEDLRTQISSYYAEVENRSQYRFITQQIQLKYLDYRVGILTDAQQIQMGSFRDSIAYSRDEAKDVLNRMLSKEKFITLLPSVIHSKIRTHENLDRRYGNTKQLIELIDKELKKK